MKKIVFILAVILINCTALNAQNEFHGGLSVGIPVGSGEEVSDFNYSLDLTYLFKINKKFDVGFSTGYTWFSGKQIGFLVTILPGGGPVISDDLGFIPVAVTTRYNLSDKFFTSIDLGYGILVTSSDNGGFYYQPKLGWKNNIISIFGFYKGISKSKRTSFTSPGTSVTSLGIGISFKIK